MGDLYEQYSAYPGSLDRATRHSEVLMLLLALIGQRPVILSGP